MAMVSGGIPTGWRVVPSSAPPWGGETWSDEPDGLLASYALRAGVPLASGEPALPAPGRLPGESPGPDWGRVPRIDRAGADRPWSQAEDRPSPGAVAFDPFIEGPPASAPRLGDTRSAGARRRLAAALAPRPGRNGRRGTATVELTPEEAPEYGPSFQGRAGAIRGAEPFAGSMPQRPLPQARLAGAGKSASSAKSPTGGRAVI
jgi:hypothetical protein